MQTSGKGRGKKDPILMEAKGGKPGVQIMKVSTLSRCLKILTNMRVSKAAVIAAQAVSESLVKEIINLVYHMCAEDKKKLAMPKHVIYGIRSDHDLNILRKSLLLREGETFKGVRDEVRRLGPKKKAPPKAPPAA